MTYYYVRRQGVNTQGIFYIGLKLEEAQDRARALAYHDHDDYHEWQVVAHEDVGDPNWREIKYSNGERNVKIAASYNKKSFVTN